MKLMASKSKAQLLEYYEKLDSSDLPSSMFRSVDHVDRGSEIIHQWFTHCNDATILSDSIHLFIPFQFVAVG